MEACYHPPGSTVKQHRRGIIAARAPVDERTEITSPTTPAGTAALPPAPPAEKIGVFATARRRALRWGFLAVFLAGALAALGGYWNGSAQRQTSQASLVR